MTDWQCPECGCGFPDPKHTDAVDYGSYGTLRCPKCDELIVNYD